jgi:hypothetical protein
MASTYLSKTPSSAGNRKTFTFSTWIKRSNLSSAQTIFMGGQSDGNNNITVCQFQSADTLRFYSYSSAFSFQLITNRLFRDTSAWMHIVVAVDTTQATSSNRIKIYINGVQETSFSTETYPSQNFDTYINNNNLHTIGNYNAGTEYFDGSMTHFHFVDGTAYDASTFGESDSVSSIWKPKTAPSVTYGNNGFFLKFENSGAMGTDSSGESNTFTVSGTLTQNVDTPSNNFATWNPLIPQGLAYANGNLSVTHDASSWKTAYGTLAMSGTGKYYFESKVSALGSYQGIGIVDAEQISASASKFGAESRGYGYKNDASKTNNNSDASYGATYTTGDIIGCALDLTNGAIYFSKNGAWQNSATTSEIAAGTTTNAAYTSISSSYVYLPAVQIYGSGTNQFNAGNGIFGTTAVSSVQNPSSGDTSAKFEYTPPTGFQPITTKGLNA